MRAFLAAAVLLASAVSAWSPGDSKPHIVYILADDMGYGDVPWQDSLLQTPILKAYAEGGIIFDQFYAQPSCSPSRAAFLTGRFPIHTGFNEGALGWKTKAGLNTTFPTIAEVLDPLGYESHMVGKWHLGSCTKDWYPNSRGFDSFTGILHSGSDHYTYEADLSGDTCYDLHYNHDVDTSANGTYSSVLYADRTVSIIENHNTSVPLFMYMALPQIHTPLQYPEEYDTTYKGYPKNYGISNKRKQGMAMITALDDALDDVFTALDTAGMLDNTIIIFSSDNGGQAISGGASNEPLRGQKNTWWEGGIRVPAFIYSKLFDSSMNGVTNNCLFDISDWFATLYRLAGGTVSDLSNIDGVDQWSTIADSSATCPRTELLHNIIGSSSDDDDWVAAYRYGDYKLIWGTPGTTNGWYYNNGSSTDGDATDTYYLYNLADDPSETTNLASNSDYDGTLTTMKTKILSFVDGMVSFNNTNSDKCVIDDVISDGLCSGFCCE